jgi:purine-nucleoside phosphorylase
VTADRPGDAVAMPGPGDTFAEEGVAIIRERCDLEPEFALVLGSGLSEAVGQDVEPCHEFSFRALPGFPPSGVPGQARRLAMGRLYGRPAAVFFGRVHYYEGYGIASATLIPRLAAGLGVRALILTNAAGGLDPAIRPGQLMLIRDHVNLMGVNPLFGWRLADGSPAFVDLSAVYDRELGLSVESVAEREAVDLVSGTYVALSGPSYETPAEIAFLAKVGATAVGMSTVPEATAGVAVGLRILALSCVTNIAGGHSTHHEVLDTAKRASSDLRAILMGVIREGGSGGL